MPTLHLTTRAGDSRILAGDAGLSVMEIIRDNGIDELLALCGGCLSCATCHVHVDAGDFAKLPPMRADESELLSGSAHRTATSRLSCQIKLMPELDGLRVTIAEED